MCNSVCGDLIANYWVLQWDFDKAQIFFDQLRGAFNDKRIHAMCNL